MEWVLADVTHEHAWCCFGDDVHFVPPIPCRAITEYRLDIAESRFASARLIAQPPQEETAGAVTVRWRHGFFGMVRYRLVANIELRPVDGASLLIFRVDFSPNPVPLGSIMTCRVGLLNCGTVPIGPSLENPRGGQFVLGVPAIQDADGAVHNLSDFGLRPGEYQTDIDVNLAPGEELFIDWATSQEIPDNAITRAYRGTYLTWVELQDRLTLYGRDLSTRSEPVQIRFV